MYQANTKQKKAGVPILKPDKININAENFIKDKDGHYKIEHWFWKGSITILNLYAPSERNFKINKEKLVAVKKLKKYPLRWDILIYLSQ